ncbi:MAG: hypothetical protein VXW25_08910, partial [Pseudomonadota bacterium]|nr:hypothetical protein [Pseudomonadota bacterium]
GGYGIAGQRKGDQGRQGGQGLFHRTSSKTVRYQAGHGLWSTVSLFDISPNSVLAMSGAVKGNVVPVPIAGPGHRAA